MAENNLIDFAKWILKRLGFLCLIILALILAFLGYFWADDYLNNQLPRKKVIIEVSVNDDCGPEYPLLVKILNGSSKTIEKVSFDLIAKYPGRSTNVTGFHNYSDDHILEPATGWGNCWRAPLDDAHKAEPANSFVWSAKINYITFK